MNTFDREAFIESVFKWLVVEFDISPEKFQDVKDILSKQFIDYSPEPYHFPSSELYTFYFEQRKMFCNEYEELANFNRSIRFTGRKIH